MAGDEAVRKLATECGVDLVGVASVDRFAGVRAEANPLSIKPDARSVIVLGFQIPRGALRGVELGTAWQTYVVALAPSLIESTYQVCRAIEADGWEAVPLYNHSNDFRNQGVRAAADKPEPNVVLDMDYAAHAAGLGEVGRGKFFLTPEFGPRQIFTAVVTDMEVAADEPFAGKVCDDCGACAAACPALAMDAEDVRTSPLAAGEARWYGLRLESCQICKTGTVTLPYSSKSEPFRAAAACGRACVAHLEDGGRLTRKFRFPFREAAGR
jgi:epoxyqueuosine reductase QueG